MKNKIKYLLLVLLLTSCNTTGYQNYLGKMYLSSSSMNYDDISTINILNKEIESQSTFYGETYLISKGSSLPSTVTVSSAEEEKINKLNDETNMLYVFTQIPSGYKAYKRDNVQKKLDNQEVLVTDNLYYFLNNLNLYYCEIDLTLDETISENYVFAFYFVYSNSLDIKLSSDNVRLIYKLH